MGILNSFATWKRSVSRFINSKKNEFPQSNLFQEKRNLQNLVLHIFPFAGRKY